MTQVVQADAVAIRRAFGISRAGFLRSAQMFAELAQSAAAKGGITVSKGCGFCEDKASCK